MRMTKERVDGEDVNVALASSAGGITGITGKVSYVGFTMGRIRK